MNKVAVFIDLDALSKGQWSEMFNYLRDKGMSTVIRLQDVEEDDIIEYIENNYHKHEQTNA